MLQREAQWKASGSTGLSAVGVAAVDMGVVPISLLGGFAYSPLPDSSSAMFSAVHSRAVIVDAGTPSPLVSCLLLL